MSDEWKLIIPIENVKFGNDKQKHIIGNVTFFEKRTYDYSKIPLNNDFYEKWVKIYKDLWREQILCEISVSADNPESARKSAFKELSRATDYLSLYYPTRYIEEPTFGVHYLLWNITKNKLLIGKKAGITFEIWINDELSNFMDIYTFPLGNSTDIEGRLSKAIHFFRKGNCSVRDEDKFLMYVIAMESLLTAKEMRKTDLLKKRLNNILLVSKKNEKKFKELVGELYEIRGLIVHEGVTAKFKLKNGKPKDLEVETKNLREITKQTILYVADIVKSSPCETLADVLTEIPKKVGKLRRKELSYARGYGIRPDTDYSCTGELRQDGRTVSDIDFIFRIEDGRYVKKVGRLIGHQVPKRCTSADFEIEGYIKKLDLKIHISEMENMLFKLCSPPMSDTNPKFEIYSYKISKTKNAKVSDQK